MFSSLGAAFCYQKNGADSFGIFELKAGKAVNFVGLYITLKLKLGH